MYWWKRLNKRLFDFEQEGYSGIFELANDLQDEDSKLHCQHCGGIMPYFKMVVIAKSVRIGETYKVKCRHCGKTNILVKGENNAER